jgi:hypothetical protein
LVSVWVKPPLTASIDEDGVVRLSNGREFALSDIPGNDWTQPRLAKLSEFAQNFFDHIEPLASLPEDDPDKTATAAQLFAQYGNRRFLDGKGNIVSRSTEISFTHDGARLVPHCRVVR